MKYKKKSHEPYQYSIELYALFAKKKCSFCLLPLYIPPKIYLWYILVQLRNCPIISYVEYLPNNSLYDIFFFFFGGLNMRTQFKLLFSILFHLIIKIASYLYVEELPCTSCLLFIKRDLMLFLVPTVVLSRCFILLKSQIFFLGSFGSVCHSKAFQLAISIIKGLFHCI